MSRDRLLLLKPGFKDNKYPEDSFVCPDCLPIEGLLAGDPQRASRLVIEHHAYERPRQAVIAALDAEHQGLPVLILGDALPPPADALRLGETYFVTNTRRILDLLAERHGYPRVH